MRQHALLSTVLAFFFSVACERGDGWFEPWYCTAFKNNCSHKCLRVAYIWKPMWMFVFICNRKRVLFIAYIKTNHNTYLIGVFAHIHHIRININRRIKSLLTLLNVIHSSPCLRKMWRSEQHCRSFTKRKKVKKWLVLCFHIYKNAFAEIRKNKHTVVRMQVHGRWKKFSSV